MKLFLRVLICQFSGILYPLSFHCLDIKVLKDNICAKIGKLHCGRDSSTHRLSSRFNSNTV
jgi:hypothetical protein